MDRIDWKEAVKVYDLWSHGLITDRQAQDLLSEAGIPHVYVEKILTFNNEFGHFGHLGKTRCFLNVESGDLFIVNWIQNVPTLWSWVEISENAYKIISERRN